MSLAFPPSTKIYLSLAPCDMRKGFDGLSAQVRNILQLDPFSGAVFLFRGKRGDRLKALFISGWRNQNTVPHGITWRVYAVRVCAEASLCEQRLSGRYVGVLQYSDA